MKKYQSYKPTDVEWIGEIPEHWEFLPLKYYYSYTKGKNGQLLTKSFLQELGDGLFPVYSGMTENDGVIGYWNKYEFDFDNDVIFTTTVGAKFMTTKTLKGKFSLSQNCLIMFTKNEKSDPSFIHYYLEYDFLFKKELIPIIIQPSLRMEDLDTFKICLPPMREQKQIVRFLDEKTELIDRLISTKEQKIELLIHQRTSLINEVIIKGLNPEVKMKESGVEWIGKVPEHWVKGKLKNLLTDKPDNGLFKRKDDFGGGVKFVNVSDLFNQNNKIDIEKLERVCVTENELKKSKLDDGDIFFVRSSLKLEGIGVSSIIENINEPVVYDCHIIRVKPNRNKIDPNFLISILNSYTYRVYLISVSETVTMTTISQDKIKELVFFTPPIDEQQKIIKYLTTRTKEIDDLILMEQNKIDLLKEYRQSLISEVITGKIDVRTNLN